MLPNRKPEGDGAVTNIEPLEAETWFRAFRALGVRASGTPNDLEAQLRHAYHLVQLVPHPLQEIIRVDCDEEKFEAFLTCEAFCSAALSLVSPPLGYSITQFEDSQIRASITLPGRENGTVANGSTLGRALLKAWTQCLISLEDRTVRRRLAGETCRLADPVPHRSRSEQHQKSN